MVESLKKTGVVELPLHYGRAPNWLITRMRGLAREIVTVIIDEYGGSGLLRRLVDPHWFQALGCVLGFDWHSSGITTVVTWVLKQALKPEDHGVAVAGGKGRFSKRTPNEISKIGKKFNFSQDEVKALQYSSRISAKVDNTAIQAGYPLYHHAFFVDVEGRWVVIQQGICTADRTARRYHWFSGKIKSYVVEPHDAIVGEAVRERVLDMTARESEGNRRASVDLVEDGPRRVKRAFKAIRPKYQETLRKWTQGDLREDYSVNYLLMPRRINWRALKKAYEFHPKNYEELLGIQGIGPSTVRGLALISELIYGEKPSWKDPVKYSFCVGGKDGVPFPVDRPVYDEIIEVIGNAIEEAKIGDKERINAIRRLSTFLEKK
jgi:hypothetical protein